MPELKWQEVNDDQIAEVGFAAPDTLGIRFVKGGEYQYENVTPRMHRALMAAELKYHYFAESIRKHPDLYPYQKIVSNGAVELPPANNALAKIDNLKPEEVFKPGHMDSLLMAIREEALAEAKLLDISTEPKRKALKSLAFRVVKSRTYIEGLHKSYTQAEKKRLATVDAEKRRICEILQGIEDEVRAPLTEWENKEKARVQAHEDAIAAIKESPAYGQTETIAELEQRLVWLDLQRERNWEEWAVAATQAIDDEVERVEGLLAAAKIREAERAELEKLRAESAKRTEQERLEAAAKAAREQAEREAKQREEQAALDAAAELARVERERLAAIERAETAEKMRVAEEQAAQRRAEEAAAQAKRDAEAAVEAERQRVAAEAERKRKEDEARAADEKHCETVIQEAQAGLFDLGGMSLAHARTIVEAIAAGKIPHVTIQF